MLGSSHCSNHPFTTNWIGLKTISSESRFILLGLMTLYYLGGFLCGLSLSVYAVFSLRHKFRAVWYYGLGISLGMGWWLFTVGCLASIHAQYTLPKNYTWFDYWAGLSEIGPLFWWIALVIYLIVRRKERAANSPIEFPDNPSDGVWPPPPTK